MPKFTNKDLKSMFNYLNIRFFDSRLCPKMIVKFAELEAGDQGTFQGDEILISKDFQKHIDIAAIILLHEMTHADMPEYRGQDGRIIKNADGTHGMRFQAKIHSLFEAGAYDGFL